MSSVNKVLLAIYLHEISPAHGDWYPWRKLSPEGREGWLVQAERLLSIYDITPKEAGASAIGPSPEPDTRKRVPEQVPSVGRIVHYVSYGTSDGSEHRAAVITEVWTQCNNVCLCVVHPTHMVFKCDVEYDESCKLGTWHWCEHVPAK